MQTFSTNSILLEIEFANKLISKIKMDELTYKDLSQTELNALKDMYISSRVETMTESDLRKFVKEIIIDQIKGTVGNAEEKEAWEEIKDHFSEDLSKKIQEVKEKYNKNYKADLKSPEEIEFNRRLDLLKQQQEEKTSKDMWDD
tara:strand:+ start:253 stop:684 length:432 start_codon:yes stop_codon:yes gene_type:complete